MRTASLCPEPQSVHSQPQNKEWLAVMDEDEYLGGGGEYIISMRTNLPQVQAGIKEALHKEPSLKKMAPTPRINVKGITLRDYFRMCEEAAFHTPIREAPEDSSSSRSSLVQTPSFNHPNSRRLVRIKIKTDISDDPAEPIVRPYAARQLPQDHDSTNRSTNIPHSYSSDKSHKIFYFRENNPFKRKETRKKVLTNLHCSSNRGEATMGVGVGEENRNRMLRKMEAQRERVNELRLSDAFMVNKYNSKFHIDAKELIRNE